MNSEISLQAYQFWNENKALEAGKIVYEAIPRKSRPDWASKILSLCLKLTHSKPEFLNLINLASSADKWKNAYEAFQSVRTLTLIDEKSGCPDLIFTGVLHLAENTAKVTYNAGNLPAPFDHNAGWSIIENVKFIVERVNSKEFEKRVLQLAFEFEVDE